MGNRPSEYYGVKCGICDRALPPCRSWSGFQLQTIDREVDVVRAYNFLNGRYYRIMCRSTYYCPDDFWRPRNEYRVQQEQERRRHEKQERRERERQAELSRQQEEARRREEARKQEQQEQSRLREQQRQEELRRQEEARREAVRSEGLTEQSERSQQRFADYTVTEEEVDSAAPSSSYRPIENMEPVVYDGTYYDELLREEVSSSDDTENVSNELVESVIYSLGLLSVDDKELDSAWLRSAQIVLLTHYLQSNSFSKLDKESVLDFLAYLQVDLSDKEYLTLAKTMEELRDTNPMDFGENLNFQLDENLPLQAKVASVLIHGGRIYNERSLWLQRCLFTVLSSKTQDQELSTHFLEMICRHWTTYDMLELFQKLAAAKIPAATQKQVLHLVQTYCLDPTFVKTCVDQGQANLITSLTNRHQNEENKGLEQLMREIRESGLLEEPFLAKVNSIARAVYTELATINMKLDHQTRLQSSKASSIATFRSLLSDSATVTDTQIAKAIITLMCAVRKFNPWYPRRTQVVALIILILTGKNGANKLLEMKTGEGKSCLVALFATVLCMQQKKVDVVTSSPILAVRDVEEWASYYQEFGFTVSHNTDLERNMDANMDAVKEACYRSNIIYGTTGNFCADILRDEFQKKNLRNKRPCEAVIVDEVDMLMLDEGVQFTYLSHTAAILSHVESVFAIVWALIGPLRMTLTADRNVLYAGTPKLFTEAIFECLDKEITGIDNPNQILKIAVNAETDPKIITEDQYRRLTSENEEEKKLAIAEIKRSQALSLLEELKGYQNMPEFLTYAANSDNILEADGTVSNYSDAEKLLILNNGLACPLNTKEEVVERATAILQEKLKFTDDAENEISKQTPVKEIPVKLPLFLQSFVMNQIPTYVESAIRALHMEEDREYAISYGKIIPVDFQNSGVMELNKKWGGGLQQMLEIKHDLAISPVSLVTNFMSNVDFFTRYQKNGVYGMSGTLGLDPWSNTTAVLNQLYNASVCSIPTFKDRKLFEKPAIIVETKEKWYQQIVSTVNEESRQAASWKTGRAALILCEDIKSAEDLKKYVIQNAKWPEEKVYLYAHSNSTQLTTIKNKHKLTRGDVIIATNLAGRGTNIKVKDDVNESGGLLCLVTFLARNRRVELQAFGRTARAGKPGSVRCILDASGMPSHYFGLDIQTIRKVRAEEESLRLNVLMNYDVEESRLKEELFKSHCSYLSGIYNKFENREDLRVVVDSINENWGAWLETKRNQIELLQKDVLKAELSTAQTQWKPELPKTASGVVTLPNSNFYHFVQFGNQLIIEQGQSSIQRAIDYYTKSIEMQSRYGLIPRYNRAYCRITNETTNYKTEALDDIKAAVNSVDKYMDELSLVNTCVNMVRQMRVTVQREGDGTMSKTDPRDFRAQIQARFDIYTFLKQKMKEAIAKIEELDGSNYTAKPVGIFSLIPDANYTTNLELTSLWTLGLEIVYTIEKKPEFNWGALGVFLLGIAQIVAGVLLAVFTVGIAASVGMSFIGEGVSDCIAGIEGMVTGEFDWVEWGISKATGLALSLISGGVSRLATTGIKAVKTGFKVAKTAGRQLKAIPTAAKTAVGTAAKKNLQKAAEYTVKEVALQGLDYATGKAFDAAMSGIYSRIGQKLKENLEPLLSAEFTNNGYFAGVVDQRYTALLDSSYSTSSEVSKITQSSAKKHFNRLNDATLRALSNDSNIKTRLTTTSLSLFQKVAEENPRNKKVKFVAHVLEATILTGMITDAVTNLQVIVDQYIPKMKEMSRKANTADKVTNSPDDGAAYRNYNCVIKLKTDVAAYLVGQFSESITALIQGKLSPMISHAMNRTIGTVTHNVVDKYVVRSDNTLEQLTAGQHANYIRSVGADESGSSQVSSDLVASYANHVQDSNNAGSIMELRIATERYGQGVVIYQEKNGQLVKNSSIEPKNRTTDENIKLIYTPPPDDDSVGHYDVEVNGVRKRVEADNSNCLFHAFALGREPNLTKDELKARAQTMRADVAREIRDEPQKWGEHITLRTEMDNLRRGNRLALIGAGPPDPKTKVLQGFYKEEAKGRKIYTMYRQANGIVAKAIKTYNKPLNVVNGLATTPDPQLQNIKVHMKNLNLSTSKGKRCWATQPVWGMIKRFKGKAKDSEVSFHLIPSRAGANAGEKYSNAVMTSPHYNNMEKLIWTKEMYDVIGTSDFEMTVEGKCGKVDQTYQGSKPLTRTEKTRLKRRSEEMEQVDPRVYRMEETIYDIHLPTGTTAKDLADIQNACTLSCTVDATTNTVRITLPADDELFVPTDLTTLDANGELYANELTNAYPKVPRMAIGDPPTYRVQPTVTTGFAAQQATFNTDFTNFMKNGF